MSMTDEKLRNIRSRIWSRRYIARALCSDEDNDEAHVALVGALDDSAALLDEVRRLKSELADAQHNADGWQRMHADAVRLMQDSDAEVRRLKKVEEAAKKLDAAPVIGVTLIGVANQEFMALRAALKESADG